MAKASFNWIDPLLLDQQLTEEERMVQGSARQFAADKLAPRVLEAFRHERTDPAIFREMGETGLLGATIPEAYGGSGLNYVCYGLVAPLYESAKVLADRLIGGHSEYHGSVTNTKLKVTGINLFSAGDFAEGDDREEIVLRDAGQIGRLSDPIEAQAVIFRTNEPGYDYDWHTAPQRQFIVLLDGAIEIEASDGNRRTLRGGDVLLMEDTTGKGHRTRNVEPRERRSLFIVLDDDNRPRGA